MNRLKTMLPYLIITAAAFYALPPVCRNTGTSMVLLLLAIPMICLICAACFGAKYRFDWLYTVLVMALFVPTLFLYYNVSAWVYIPVYGVLTLIGNLFGRLFQSK